MRRALATAAVVAVLLASLSAGCYLVATPDGMAVGIAPPAMAYIPNTGIRIVSGVPGDVFYYDSVYWRWYNGYWWRSSMWNGGWVVVSSVPRVFLSIPVSHRAYRVVRHHPLFKPSVLSTKSSPAIRAPADKSFVRPAARKATGRRKTKKRPGRSR